MIRPLLLSAMLLATPGLAHADDSAPSQTPDTHAPITADTKFDIGSVQTIDAEHGIMVCTMASGQVTYDVTNAQVFDTEGKPQGAAASLKTGDKVRVMYVINNGAKVSEVKLVK